MNGNKEHENWIGCEEVRVEVKNAFGAESIQTGGGSDVESGQMLCMKPY